MKEASGELSMTLIVIIAAGVILAIFLAFKDPITNAIGDKWGNFFNKGRSLDSQNSIYLYFTFVCSYSI